MSNSSQIFQTNKPARWRNVKWSGRILAMITIFFLVILGVAIYSGSLPTKPNQEARSRAYQPLMDPSNPFTFSHSQNKKYKGFKDFLNKKVRDEADSLKKTQRFFYGDTAKNEPYIRAAFYTPWTSTTSLPDLEKNGDKLNTIFPEWFFIDSISKFKLSTRIDSAGLAMMRNKGLTIIPMISNYNASLKPRADFDGSLLHTILNDSIKRKAFLKQLVDTLSYYDLQGVNIDFENIDEPTNDALTRFQKELYQQLHSRDLVVTMDVEVKNNDYDYTALSNYNDYIILMAYDQFSAPENPGPVSAQRWIEEAVDWTVKKIDPEKIILGFAGYGYDWKTDAEGNKTDSVVTYGGAINQAKIAGAKIIFDNDTYNLHYSYISQEEDSAGNMESSKHEVWFTDAATIFNILRFSDEYATAGTVLWRLGGEDTRMWQYYNHDLSDDELSTHPFDFNTLTNIPIDPNGKPGYLGTGEVLDIMSLPQAGKIKFEIDTTDQLIAEQEYLQLPSGYIIQRFAEDATTGRGHKLILTFDDGPDPEWTPEILDILEKEKVPATFFVVGMNVEKNIPLLQRIDHDGFEIGNHTFTHSNLAKMSLARAEVEMKLTRILIETFTGKSTILFRAPYNADSEPQTFDELEPIARSARENYLTVGESIDPMDWQKGVTADSIFARVVSQVEDRNASIILLHDAGGDTRAATVAALPRIIDYFKKKGYKFTTVADLMGKTKADVMPSIPAARDGWIRKLNFFLAETTYWGGQVLFALFLIGIALSIGRMIAMGILASMQKRKENVYSRNGSVANIAEIKPTVCVIVPAYNEQINAVRTVNSLLAQDYKNLQIIFVDDGSKDHTFKIVKDTFKYLQNVQVLSKQNGGKASALNFGIEKAESEFVVCIDADTQLKFDAVTQLMQKFDNDNVAAVAGNVKVGNEINMITKWQSIEYITSQNFDRRAFDLLNCITVVPGALGAFRKNAIQKAGGFTTDTLAEDCDVTMRLHRNGYEIRNCTTALSYTEAPETMKQFMKQRFRWSFGVMQCFWKHRDTVFNFKFKNFGMIAMPNILIYQMLLPFLAPLADIILVMSLLAASFGIIAASISHIIFYYAVFSVVDIAGAALAFAFEKEDYKKLIWMIPQRLIYRQMMYFILLKSFNKALKGEMQGWGVLKRTGRVKVVKHSPL